MGLFNQPPMGPTISWLRLRKCFSQLYGLSIA